MIFRKPYAFLIKNFKFIHVILTFFAIYVLLELSAISSFFRSYVANNYTAVITSDFSSNFLSWMIFTFIVILILLLVAIIYLLRHKGRRNTIYVMGIINYIALFALLLFFNTVFNAMEQGVVSADTSRVYRDITLLMYIPQYIFVIFFGIRALGFNVKQFNFSKDLRELQLSSADNEEVEVNLEFDTHKAKRNFRKYIREFKYYLKENLLMIIIVVLGLGSWLTYSLVTTSSFYNNTSYSEKQEFVYENLNFTIEESFITNVDEGGNIISEDKYFVILQVKIENTTIDGIIVDPNELNLSFGDKSITPQVSYGEYFSDYGRKFPLTKINENTSFTYVLPYIIEKEDIENDFTFELYTNTIENDGVKYPIYTVVNLDTYIQSSSLKSDSKKLNEELFFYNTNIGNTSILIDSYKTSKSYYYQAEECFRGDCKYYTDYVVLDYSKGDYDKILLIINDGLTIDKETIYYQNNLLKSEFFTNFAKIEYEYNDETYIADVTGVEVDNLISELILKVPEEVADAKIVTLIFTIRNKEFRYEIKNLYE